MKNPHILLLASLFTLHASLVAQQYGWVDISGNVPDFPGDTIYYNGGQDTLLAGFRSLCFLNDNEGWISTLVFDSCVILHTVNGGDSWEIQDIPFPELIVAIDMKDSQHGYAASAEGTIFHTNNGGESWEFHGPTFALALTDMDFPPHSDTGYACGMNGAIFRITPVGVENMVSDVVSDLASIQFISPDHGWVCGQAIVKEYENGEWVAGHAYNNGHWNDIFFVDELNGWGAGQWLTFPTDTVGILHTSNDSAWYSQPLSVGNTGDMSQVFFLDLQHGWAVHFNGKIYATSNGGNTWSEQSPGITSEMLANLQMTSLTNGYICGNNRTLLKYTQLSGTEVWGQGSGKAGKQGSVEVWPNPTRGEFKVQSASRRTKFKVEFESLELLDIYGKSLNCSPLHRLGEGPGVEAETLELDISHLPAGIYFIKINLENQTIVKKIIKL